MSCIVMFYSSGFGTRNDDYDNDFSRDGSDKYNDMTTFAKMRAGAGKRKHLFMQIKRKLKKFNYINETFLLQL